MEVQKIQKKFPEEVVKIDEEALQQYSNAPIPVSALTKLRYYAYVACATSTRITLWILLVTIIIATILASTLIAVFRYEWKNSISAPGPLLLWNGTAVQTVNPPSIYKRIKRAIHYQTDPVNLHIQEIPQGVFLQPHPKPILSKERVLGLSHVIIIDSTILAKETEITDHYIQLMLHQMLQEEIEQLQHITLDFDLPLTQPDTQQDYVDRKCYQSFGHCYYIQYSEDRQWPTPQILADYCPLPSLMPNIPQPVKQAAWDYYLKPPTFVPEDWTEKKNQEGARTGSYRVPGGQKATWKGVVFCSDDLYSDWYKPYENSEEQYKLTRQKIEEFLKKGTNVNELKPSVLPHEWNPQGTGKMFRTLKDVEFCQRPEAVTFLNTSAYDWSLWEGDCDIYRNNITTFVKACKTFQPSPRQHPYACRHLHLKEGKEEVKCLDQTDKKKCLLYTEYSQIEAMTDFGLLAYLKYFPSVECIQSHPITKKPATWKILSVYKECVTKGMQYDLDDVITQLREKLTVKVSNSFSTFLGDLPPSRAFWGTQNQLSWPTEYKNKTIKQQMQCSPPQTRRQKRSNIEKVQSSSLLLSQAISKLSKISDLNDQNLAHGIHLLKEHIVTLMEATISDVNYLGQHAALQWLHTHISDMKQTLMNSQVPWSIIKSKWIQESLDLTDEVMNVIRRSAKALVYKIQEKETSIGTQWEIAIYYELIIPKKIYRRNWEVINLGHIVRNSGELTHVWIKHPYEYVNQDCEKLNYLHTIDCIEEDYIICDQIKEVLPCGNKTGSDCPVMAKTLEDEFLNITPLKNGSYIIMSSISDCAIPPYEPVLVTVNATVTCFDNILRKPLRVEETTTLLIGNVPRIQLRLPHLVGIIAKIRNIEVQITSTWESIKDQVERAQEELLQLDLHEGDVPDWIKRLGKSLEDIWPAAADIIQNIGHFVGKVTDSIFGTAFSILSYAKPVIICIIVFLVLFFIVKIISWLPRTHAKTS